MPDTRLDPDSGRLSCMVIWGLSHGNGWLVEVNASLHARVAAPRELGPWKSPECREEQLQALAGGP